MGICQAQSDTAGTPMDSSAIAPSAVDYWICKCYYRNISLHTEA